MDNNIKVKKGEKCPTCQSYYDRTVSVDGLIVSDNKILLILRNAGQEIGKWALIGGIVDWNETVEEAMLREVKEEIGVNIKIVKLLGVYSDPTRDPNNTQTIALAYLLKLHDENFKLQKEEIKDVKWYPLNELPENMAFDHRKIIEDYIKNHEI